MSSITETDGVLRLHVGDAWADVAPFGSTVIGWHPASSRSKDQSLIFLSKETKPGKAYRGGIPLVFPVFGEVKDHGQVPDAIKNCTRHGFCRDRPWKLADKKSSDSNSASVSMSLSSQDEPALLEKFPCPFSLLHTVTLSKDTLESKLQIQHLESSQQDSMPFHALFHTYLSLPSQTAKVSGLKSVSFNDKVAGKRVSENEDEEQGWSQELDRVYEGKAEALTINANDGSGDQITLKRSDTLPDTTLWNPGKAADDNMSDLHDGGWKDFVCAEPGHVSSFAWLPKGQQWTGTQTLSYKNTNGSSSSAGKEAGKDAALATAAGGAGVAAAATASSQSKSGNAKTEGSKDTDNDGKESAAASLIQRQYRSYVSRREQDGLRLSPEARWGDAVGRARIDGATKAAMSGDKNDSTNRWKRGGLLVGQLAGSPSTQLDAANTGPVEGGPSLEPHPSLDAAMTDRKDSGISAPSREESKGVIGDVPGANDNGKVDNIRSIADKNQYGLKMIERWTRGAPAQELSKVMEAQYWLEMVDRKHRYGSNLKYYHAAWSKDEQTKDNFFKWLDEGKGKQLDLPECSREQLEREQVTYLSSEQRANYIIDVKDGKLVFRRNGKFVDTTTGRWRDLGDGRGIVELGEEEKAELRRQREERAARKGRKVRDDDDSLSSSSSSSSSSDDDGEGALNSEEEEAEKDRARHYGGDDGKSKKGLRAFTPAGTWDRLLRKTVQNNVWIYVYNSRHELFVGIKTTGKFQHSSFLYGGRVLSAGLLRAKDGYLTSLSPLSGHYRAGSAHFRFFVASLQDSGVDLSKVTLSKSLLMLHGLEQYGKLNKKLKGKSTKEKKTKGAIDKKGGGGEEGEKAQSDEKDATQAKDGISGKLHKLGLHSVLSRSSKNSEAA